MDHKMELSNEQLEQVSGGAGSSEQGWQQIYHLMSVLENVVGKEPATSGQFKTLQIFFRAKNAGDVYKSAETLKQNINNSNMKDTLKASTSTICDTIMRIAAKLMGNF